MMMVGSRKANLRGVWPAIVVDNSDGGDNPGYRVKLKLPWLSDDETTHWARIAVPMAGPGRGSYMLPEIDDQVLVVFEHGDIGRPIVIGGLWSKKQEPVEVHQSGKNNTKLIKSRCGHRIIFDDSDGAARITIVDRSAKNKIVLDSASKLVKIESDGDLEVIAKANVILHGNAIQVGASDGVTGKAALLLAHAVKTFGLKAVDAITIGGGNTTINMANAAACNVSGTGSGELGGAAAERPKHPVAEYVRGDGRSGSAAGDQAAGRPTVAGSPRSSPKIVPAEELPTQEAPRTERVAFVVIDHDDRPIRGAVLTVRLADGSQTNHTTGGDGSVVISQAPIGSCTPVVDPGQLAFATTLELVDVSLREPSPAVPDGPPYERGLRIAEVEHHRVRSGETLAGLAEAAEMTWQELARFNFDTDEPTKINAKLRALVGCRTMTNDGRNYQFSDDDEPGIVYIPKRWQRAPLDTGQTHILYVRPLQRPLRSVAFSV
jgi:phage baseplate assembly protein gpV